MIQHCHKSGSEKKCTQNVERKWLKEKIKHTAENLLFRANFGVQFPIFHTNAEFYWSNLQIQFLVFFSNPKVLDFQSFLYM